MNGNECLEAAGIRPAHCGPVAERREGLEHHHREALHRRGLTDATITAAGLISIVSPRELMGRMRWKKERKKSAPAILIPFQSLNGQQGYYRCRPDIPRTDRHGKPVKYESPPGEPNRVYFPTGAIEHLSNTNQEIAITEGEFKSLAATQELLPTLGLVGVWGWKPKDLQRLIPELEAVSWAGRRVYLIPDSDFDSNPGVRAAFAWLAKHLKDRGAIVKLVHLPDAEDGGKLGVDDFLAKHGANGKRELRTLLDAAEDPPPVDPEAVKINAENADPAKEAAAILKATEKDGCYRLRSYRGECILWNSGKYAPLPESDVQAQVTTDLNRHCFMVKRSHVANVIAQMKAQGVIYSSITPPAWIGDGERRWHPEETIVCKNGIVNLASFTRGASEDEYLSPATPKFFTFTALDYDFNADAPTPRKWLEFLGQIWRDDQQSIDGLQEWAGYLLVHWTNLQKILCIIGPRRAGKGTIARVLRSVIGEHNVASPSLSSLSREYGLWGLCNKTAAFITDARLSGRTDSAIVVERLLNVSGEDSVDVERKYLETLKSVVLPTRIVLFSNELPGLNDSSGALSGRLIALRLKQTFFGRENTNLTNELLTERQGILKWAIVGWQRLRDRGHFVQPEAARELVDQMEELTSPVGAFVKDCCILDPASNISVAGIFKAWCWWCEQNGRQPSTSAILGRNLTAAFSEINRTHPRNENDSRYRAYDGIGLNDDTFRAVYGNRSNVSETGEPAESSEFPD